MYIETSITQLEKIVQDRQCFTRYVSRAINISSYICILVHLKMCESSRLFSTPISSRFLWQVNNISKGEHS